MFPPSGRSRVVVEDLQPLVDGGRFPVKRTVGEFVHVCVRMFTDGHDVIAGVIQYRFTASRKPGSNPVWQAVPLTAGDNDLWSGIVPLPQAGPLEFQVVAWVDHFLSWRRDLSKRIDAGQDIRVDLEIGARLIDAAGSRAAEIADQHALARWAGHIRLNQTAEAGREACESNELLTLMTHYADRSLATVSEQKGLVFVDRERAGFSAWYEAFPRSCSSIPGQHGTLRDVIDFLPYVASMGFDVLYLPPIHPVGTTHRKGRNNAPACEPGEVGSPWAIGSTEGGHKSIHPQLGSFDDFAALVKAAHGHRMELALDIAFQCAPDHPYVKQHPDWFRQRPDGTIQYAENPPKKYQDIYPFDFECEDWQGLWTELKSIFEFWAERGVRIFRVDNPHTKAFPFWEWCLAELKASYPDLIFLSEAFTRPAVRYRLAKLGFTQSYTYFAWRNTRAELEEYLTHLSQTPVAEYFRPNFWPNTPDILTEALQTGGRAAFMSRLILAATLCPNYGIYGPAYELCEHLPVKHGSEEYLNSEKYEIRQRDLNASHSIRPLITQINAIRRAHPSLQNLRHLKFHTTDNHQILSYSRRVADQSDRLLIVVNLDPHRTHHCWISVDLNELGIPEDRPYELRDLLTGRSYQWTGSRNFVELRPHEMPAHLFEVMVPQ